MERNRKGSGGRCQVMGLWALTKAEEIHNEKLFLQRNSFR